MPLEDAKLRLELWDRDPAWTAADGNVDPVSLYLNMRHGDDLVRIALADLLRSSGSRRALITSTDSIDRRGVMKG